MEDYQTLLEALNGLKEKGYTLDFNLVNGNLQNSAKDVKLEPEEFCIDEFHRFEGMSDPDDNSVVYAISSEKYNLKGVFVNGYGVYSDDLSEELLKKLNTPS